MSRARSGRRTDARASAARPTEFVLTPDLGEVSLPAPSPPPTAAALFDQLRGLPLRTYREVRRTAKAKSDDAPTAAATRVAQSTRGRRADAAAELEEDMFASTATSSPPPTADTSGRYTRRRQQPAVMIEPATRLLFPVTPDESEAPSSPAPTARGKKSTKGRGRPKKRDASADTDTDTRTKKNNKKAAPKSKPSTRARHPSVSATPPDPSEPDEVDLTDINADAVIRTFHRASHLSRARDHSHASEIRDLRAELSQLQQQATKQQKQLTEYAKKTSAQTSTIDRQKIEIKAANKQVRDTTMRTPHERADAVPSLCPSFDTSTSRVCLVQIADLHRVVSAHESRLADAKASSHEWSKSRDAMQLEIQKRDDRIAHLREAYQNLEADFGRAQEQMQSREHALQQIEVELRAKWSEEMSSLRRDRQKQSLVQAAGHAELQAARDSLVHEQRKVELKRERWNKVWNHKQAEAALGPIQLPHRARVDDRDDFDLTVAATEEQKEERSHPRRISHPPAVAAPAVLSHMAASPAVATPPRSISSLRAGRSSSSANPSSRDRLPPSSLDRLTPPRSRHPTPERSTVAVSAATPVTPASAATTPSKFYTRHSNQSKKRSAEVLAAAPSSASQGTPAAAHSAHPFESTLSPIAVPESAAKRSRLLSPLALAETAPVTLRKVVKHTARRTRRN